eukprot:s933_g2.t1
MLLKIPAVPSLTMLCSFRRGASECCIHGVGFAADSKHLLASTANAMIHVFRCPKQAVEGISPTSLASQAAASDKAAPVLGAREPIEVEEDDDLSDWNIVDCDRAGRETRRVETGGPKVPGELVS